MSKGWSGKKLPEAKLTFEIRNIFEMDEWKNKSTFELQSVEKHLGITHMMLTSKVQALGYDLSRIDGYDPELIVNAAGWGIIKQFLLKIMQESDFQRLANELQRSEKKLNKSRMKLLWKAANGEEIA